MARSKDTGWSHEILNLVTTLPEDMLPEDTKTRENDDSRHDSVFFNVKGTNLLESTCQDSALQSHARM